jgi:hypothetical protein
MSLLKSEYQNLGKVIGEKPESSRQHFLRLSFPATYRNLISLAIKKDFSMGYAATTGFRAGICTPFRFYNLREEKETGLTVIPFQVMDRALNQYMRLSPDDACEEIRRLVAEIRNVKGRFVYEKLLEFAAD